MGFGAARFVPVLTAVVLAVGCGVTLDAPDIALILQPQGIVYAEAEGGRKLVGGETIIHVANGTEQERQVVLAHLESDTSEVPADLLGAESAREDDRILGYSRVLKPEETEYAAGGAGKVTDDTSFHVYLRPGDTYVLFDTLPPDGDAAGERLVLWLRPGGRERR
ncbi:MAG: hypothetical protein KY437_00480 [Actinobacteria bacterium]|nr:hypothetical protein [Actinomycetota bacterium]